jgi:hypothetical protein
VPEAVPCMQALHARAHGGACCRNMDSWKLHTALGSVAQTHTPCTHTPCRMQICTIADTLQCDTAWKQHIDQARRLRQLVGQVGDCALARARALVHSRWVTQPEI